MLLIARPLATVVKADCTVVGNGEVVKPAREAPPAAEHSAGIMIQLPERQLHAWASLSTTLDWISPRCVESIAPKLRLASDVATTHWTLGCDAADPHRVAAFWAAALGYVAEPGYDNPDGASIVDPDGQGPAISFLRVPEPKAAKNRMHIDIRMAGEPPWRMRERADLIRGKVAELTTAGATAVREEYDGEDLDHVVMIDPEGNEFCVA